MDVHKRTLKDIELPENVRIRAIPEYVLNFIQKRSWPYKGSEWGYGRDYYVARDKAMMSLGFLASGRINEVLRVRKAQVDLVSDLDFVVVHDFYVSKRKKATPEREGPTYIEIPMPKNNDALLFPFTGCFLEYFNICETEQLFPIKPGRAWEIVNTATCLWTHWFRSLGFTYFANMIKNPFALAKIFGVVNVNTILRYFRGTWEQYREVYTSS